MTKMLPQADLVKNTFQGLESDIFFLQIQSRKMLNAIITAMKMASKK